MRSRTYKYPPGFTPTPEYPIRCTGAVVPGDDVVFRKIDWHPAYQPHVSPHSTPHDNIGVKVLRGKVIAETKGGAKQQIFVVRLRNGDIIKVTSVTMYRGGTYRKAWSDEAFRDAVLFEKYEDRRAVRHGATKLLFEERNHVNQ